ncbi:MAG: hypothetical protein A3G75_07220 [Verrucomicrobia bacterium RIFCSPLOWO2_12_FULL_64_8]|nr:MAG: hypothetical protein A3G75_07220 [Verrucomicrobia bacterium RIFCSPLOWO2_12_FULL_64_8]
MPCTYAYRSLELAAHELWRAGTPTPFAVIADARRDTWHCVEISSPSGAQPLRRLPAPVLAEMASDLFLPADFRTWAAPPRTAQPVPYSIADLWRLQGDAELLLPLSEPDARFPEGPAYVSWTPRIHRAPNRAST